MSVNLAFRCCPRCTTVPSPILRVRPNRRCIRRRNYSVASSKVSRNPYPFPTSPDPTPYQIFHLMPDASPADIKQRYYELVRLYHPDSAQSRHREPDAQRRHAQFSAITRAYSRLQKRTAGDGYALDAEVAEGAVNPWRRAPSSHRRSYEEPQYIDDRWKDRFIWGILGFSFLTVAAQTLVVRRRQFQHAADHIHVGEQIPIRSSWNPTGTSDEDALKLRSSKDS